MGHKGLARSYVLMENLVGTINHVYLYSLEPYDLEMVGHSPLQLINVTALCNSTDFHY